MAETELEKLIVRINGDASHYKKTLNDAVKDTDEAAKKIKASVGEIEKATGGMGGGGAPIKSPFSALGMAGFGGGGGQIQQVASTLETVTSSALGLASAIGVLAAGAKLLNSDLGHELGISLDQIDFRTVNHTKHIEQMEQAYKTAIATIEHGAALRKAGQEDPLGGGNVDARARQARQLEAEMANQNQAQRDALGLQDQLNERRKELVALTMLGSGATVQQKKMAQEELDTVNKQLKDVEDRIQARHKDMEILAAERNKQLQGPGAAVAETEEFLKAAKAADKKRLKKEEAEERFATAAKKIETDLNEQLINRHDRLAHEKAMIDRRYEAERERILLTPGRGTKAEMEEQKRLLDLNKKVREQQIKDAEAADRERKDQAGRHITEKFGTAAEKRALQEKDLKKLFDQGSISALTYQRALAGLKEEKQHLGKQNAVLAGSEEAELRIAEYLKRTQITGRSGVAGNAPAPAFGKGMLPPGRFMTPKEPIDSGGFVRGKAMTEEQKAKADEMAKANRDEKMREILEKIAKNTEKTADKTPQLAAANI